MYLHDYCSLRVISLFFSAVTAPVTDDLDGDGRLDIVVATELGDVYAIATPASYHPLKVPK